MSDFPFATVNYQHRVERVTDKVIELMHDEIEQLMNIIKQKDQHIKLLKQSLISRDKFMIEEACYDKYLGLEKKEGKVEENE